MASEDLPVYLLHIRDCCERLLECAALRERGTVPEHILFDAVCRNVEILGEAASKTEPEFRAAHPEVPWRQMKAARNVLIHAYEGTDPKIVWGIVERDIPPLLTAVKLLLEGKDC